MARAGQWGAHVGGCRDVAAPSTGKGEGQCSRHFHLVLEIKSLCFKRVFLVTESAISKTSEKYIGKVIKFKWLKSSEVEQVLPHPSAV